MSERELRIRRHSENVGRTAALKEVLAVVSQHFPRRDSDIQNDAELFDAYTSAHLHLLSWLASAVREALDEARLLNVELGTAKIEDFKPSAGE